MQKKMAATFRAQGRAVLRDFVRFKRHFAEAALDTSIESMIESALKVTIPAMVKDFSATGLAGYEWGYADLANNMGMQDAFSLAHPDAVKWADKRAALRVAGVNNTTKNDIRSLIVHGLENGESYGSVQRSIKRQFTQFAVGSPLEHIQSRAELVAVTEMGEAYEAGAATLSDELEAHGIEQEKSRVGPNDGHTSDACIADLAVGWIRKGDAFPSGIMSGLEHPGCRHGTIYRVSREGEPESVPSIAAKAKATKKAAKGITVPKVPRVPKGSTSMKTASQKLNAVAGKEAEVSNAQALKVLNRAASESERLAAKYPTLRNVKINNVTVSDTMLAEERAVGMWEPNTKTLWMRKGSADKAAIERSRKQLAQKVRVHAGSDSKAIYRHELGHAVQDQLLTEEQRFLIRNEFLDANEKLIAREISQYAVTDPEEAFSELFALVSSGKKIAVKSLPKMAKIIKGILL